MMRWQDVRDMGLGLFKKMTRSRTLWISGSVTFLGVLTYIILLTGVTVTTSGNIKCGEECVSYVNVTSTYWRICFADEFDLIKTDPSGVDVEVYVPARGKGNWRLLDITKDCIERKNKYNYLPNRFKIVGHKPKSLTVKWWSDSMSIPDPIWEGVYDSDLIIDLGNNQSELMFAINWSLLDWSSIINFTSGNWTLNLTEWDVLAYNLTDWTFNITNNATTYTNVSMRIDRKEPYFELYCNNTYITTGWNKIIIDLENKTSAYMNCTMNFNNISQRYINFYNPILLENLSAYWRFSQSASNETIDWIGNNNGVVTGVDYIHGELISYGIAYKG